MSPVGSLRTSQRVKVTGEGEGKFQKERAPFCDLARIRLSGARERVPKKAYLVAAVSLGRRWRCSWRSDAHFRVDSGSTICITSGVDRAIGCLARSGWLCDFQVWRSDGTDAPAVPMLAVS